MRTVCVVCMQRYLQSDSQFQRTGLATFHHVKSKHGSIETQYGPLESMCM
jgi:hypothetical protein